ncbi:MAG: hypothetical protein ARM1_0195 [Candidatus Micrarchaeota archaeon]|nr:MAG: hypothetical protein ARM1_0195 [Candidatus Micrarchaeota archaeon]
MPLIVWISIFIIGIVLIAIAHFLSRIPLIGSVAGSLDNIGISIIFYPGDIILPLIAGLLLGDSIGRVVDKLSRAFYLCIINATYIFIIYIIIAIVLVLIFNKAVISSISYSGSFISVMAFNIGLIPLISIEVVTLLLALLSYLKHNA